MPTRLTTLVVIIAAIVLLSIGAGMVSRSAAQTTSTDQGSASAGVTIPYAGRLTDDASQPFADEAYNFLFALYDAPAGGANLWSEVQTGVKVRSGAFAVLLGSVKPIPPATLRDEQRWLEVQVRGPRDADFTALAPRQVLSIDAAKTDAPAGVAAGPACAHDHLTENWIGSNAFYAFRIENTGNGDGIQGWAIGAGYSGLYGRHSANGNGVFGRSVSGDGVAGESAGNGKSGVYGHSVYNAFGGYGVYGTSDYGRGIQGQDGGPDPDDSYAIYALGDMRTTDDLSAQDQLTVGGLATFSGGKSGFVVDFAQNDDDVPLETGDVVVITGAGPAVAGKIPMVKVRRAAIPETGAVVGVVDQHYVPAPKLSPSGSQGEMKTESRVDDAAIDPGEYLTVVTLGAFQAIKVDASYGTIAPGDLLVASPNPGYAMKATSPKPGTIIGKALAALTSGTGTIPVLITLQ